MISQTPDEKLLSLADERIRNALKNIKQLAAGLGNPQSIEFDMFRIREYMMVIDDEILVIRSIIK